MYFCLTNVKLMFLKGIKRKSAQKYITKALKQNSIVTSSKIHSLGVLVDATVFTKFPYVDEIATVFGISKELIEILYYHPNKKISEEIGGAIYTHTNLGLKGAIRNDIAANFINTEFDALLNFYDKNDLLLNLVAVRSKAKFKIGFSGINEQINDFSIATELSNISVFTFELKKYLSILNKI